MIVLDTHRLLEKIPLKIPFLIIKTNVRFSYIE